MTEPAILDQTIDSIPLVVDVDGTLIRSDLLFEAALQFIATRPWDIWRLLVWLIGGKASLKQHLFHSVDPHIATIPLRDDHVDHRGA